MSRILIVTPALNEAAALPEFIDAFIAQRAAAAPAHLLRLLVVDDGSTDGTLALLRAAAEKHSDCISYLSFTANAGHQAALIAGLLHAGDATDAVITMDADLEHPFEVVMQLIDRWQQSGAVVVHAIRASSKQLSWVKRFPSAMFYLVTGKLTGLPLQPGQADFRLWDASALRSVAAYLPHVGSLRVFASWMPGRQESVEYEQRVRADRDTRFTLRKNYELAAISIIRFSNFPLRAITALGAIGLLFSIVYGAYIAVIASRGEAVPGWSSTVITVMTMGCLQLLSIGILASYLRRLVFARDLPLYIVRESHLTAELGARHSQ